MDHINDLIADGKWEELSKAGQSAIRPLLAVALGMDELVRRNAATTLCKMGWKPKGKKWTELTEIGPRAVELLTVFLQDANSDVRRNAITALGTIGGTTASKSLISLLRDESVRYDAARAIAKIGLPAVDPLIDSLKDKEIQDESTRILAEMGRAAIDPLVSVLQQENDDVRRSAIRALAKIGDVTVAPALVAMLNDKDPLVRSSAIEALGSMRYSNALEPLIAMLKDVDPNVRRGTAWALGSIGDPRALEMLVRNIEDADSYVRTEVLSALCKMGWKPSNRRELIVSLNQLIILLSDSYERVSKYPRTRRGELETLKVMNAAFFILGEVISPLFNAALETAVHIGPHSAILDSLEPLKLGSMKTFDAYDWPLVEQQFEAATNAIKKLVSLVNQ